MSNAASNPVLTVTQPSFSCVAIVGRPQSPGLGRTLADIGQWLQAQNVKVLYEAVSGAQANIDPSQLASVEQIGKMADLAVVVGGDGTMLGLARALAQYDIPLVGINAGRLGFITDIPQERWRSAMQGIFAGHYARESRTLLTASVIRGTKTIFTAQALNDVVISRGNSGRMVDINVDVDGSFMYSQRADGLIVATPTGSTAYALSANGPIMHPSLRGLVLVLVAPQSLANRPIVLPDQSRINIRVSDSEEARVHCDMQAFASLAEGDVIEVSLCPDRVDFLHPTGHSYFATLRQKLNWHTMPSQVDRG
jgi:NAD+ kinase